MKKIFFLCLLMCSINGISQNLVPNSDFEQYTICPDSWGQISRSTFWDSYRGTVDYYNICSTNTNISPPNCMLGFQYPHSGNAYAGFYIFHSQFQNNRELIGAQFLSPLVVGQKYFISFYVNLGGSVFWEVTIASNKIGVKFSTVSYSYSNPAPINNFAHIYTDSIITDTVKWTKISGSFIADSAYSYIIIGNFFNDSLTDTLNLATTNNNYAYYYIDDVCVTTDSLYNENWTGITENNINEKEEITIYPNPCANELNVKYNNLPNEQTTISILDITRKTVIQTQTKENEFTFNTEKLAKGLYLVKVETERTVATVKVNKE